MRNAVAFFLMLVAVTAVRAEEVQWHGFENGMARSRFEKRKAVLFFRADWCPYCTEMEQKTFRDGRGPGTQPPLHPPSASTPTARPRRHGCSG